MGIVSIGTDHDPCSFALADIPGLIPGASQGAGLGIRFLKHLDRTRVLLHLVTLDPSPGRDPVRDYVALRKELATFDPQLADRTEVVALSKLDLPEVRDAYKKLRARFKRRGVELRKVSAATAEGTGELMAALAQMVQKAKSS